MSYIDSVTNAAMKAASVNYVSNGGSYEMEPFSEKDTQATVFASAKDMGMKSGGSSYDALYKYVHQVDEIPENVRAEDLIYGDMENAPTLLNKTFWHMGEAALQTFVSSLKIGAGAVGVGSFSIYQKDPKMAAAFDRMFEHFYEGSGETYYDDYVTSKVAEHKKTTDFIEQSINIIMGKLWSKKIRGHLSKLAFDPMDRLKAGIPKKDTEKLEYPTKAMYEDYTLFQLGQAFFNFPKFNDFEDLFNGLGILIHDICAAKIHIHNFKINIDTMECMGQYKFSMYDDFGLDAPDLEYTKWATYTSGIQSWFVLQHNKKFRQKERPCYKPFLNVFEINSSFTWTVPEEFREEIRRENSRWITSG